MATDTANATQSSGAGFPAGGAMPQISWDTVGGGAVSIGGTRDRWTLLVVYRGKHCPRCKRYLNTLEQMKDAWNEAGLDIIAVSADPLDKARADVAEFGWTMDVAVDLSESQMRALGLYISDPLSTAETDRRFAEPGVYCIRPDGTAQIVALSNGPAARPDLAELLDGMKFNISKDRPTRGMA
ncbi:peroxiredoxin-like family protein [Puniceibacterium sp. IMCC21224]|uniref:peroxiredoxin-like family protein n=1 Tax=Puniceibacterium sp. IMCC21224 TaxID=1618204 RepID=UPI00065D4A1B|nr:peroxiredoxin-like family protein [Puniceibacterium sp. IMCC21224]KMK67524.1 Peroxiredoxin [Puniceibacterium sp. IMCC21224]